MSPGVDAAPTSVLEISSLSVEFPGVRALDGDDLEVRAGEVHALMGENGAGKSTLLKVLGGVYSATGGTVRLRGEGVRCAPAERCARPWHHRDLPGVHALPRPDRSRERIRGTGAALPLDARDPLRGDACRMSRLVRILGVDIDPDARVADLSVSAQQLVEIAKELGTDGQVIVMDEPTAALPREESSACLMWSAGYGTRAVRWST